MKLNEIVAKKQYAVYFDYTGAGRGSEMIAGPFRSRADADEWANENGYTLDDDVFVDVYKENFDR